MTKTEKIVVSLLTIALGVLFLIWGPGRVIGYAVTGLGVYLCITGGYDYAKGKTALGIIKAIVGALIVFFPFFMTDVLIYIFGALLIVLGVMYLVLFTKIKGKNQNFAKVVVLLVALFYIAVGVLIIVNEYVTLDWLVIVIAVLLIIDGLFSLIDALSSKN